MAASDFDPYLYPGTHTLKNKLGVRDAAALEHVQDDLVAQRYADLKANLPKGPFTFDTLKDVHRQLFQDVYEWAGHPRTIGISKAHFDTPGSDRTWFADPKTIAAMSRGVFDMVDEGHSLLGVDRATFAARAAEFLNALNMIHPFREGNGRAQRLLLTAMGAAAGHPISFDITTHERMVSTSIAAQKGDLSSFTRLLEDATDPRRVAALGKAIGFLKNNTSWWNNTYIATTTAGQTYGGALVSRAGANFMMRVKENGREWIAIGDAADLPAGAKSGQRIDFTATQFSASLAPQATLSRPANSDGQKGSVLDTLLKAMRPSSNEAPQPWEQSLTPLADRVRAEDERIAKARARPAPAPAAESKPAEEPQPGSSPSKPSSGPSPG